MKSSRPFRKVPSDKSESAKPNQHFAPMKSKCFADSAMVWRFGQSNPVGWREKEFANEGSNGSGVFWGTNELTNLERPESANEGLRNRNPSERRIEYTKYPSFVRYKWYNIEATCDACEEDYPKPSPR